MMPATSSLQVLPPAARSTMPAALVCATPDPRLVHVPAWRALTIEGCAPSATWASALAPFLGLVGALSERRRARGCGGFPVGPLEVAWSVGGAPRWRLPLPHDVDDDEVGLVARAARSGQLGLSRAVVEQVPAGRMMRVLHRGFAEDLEPVFGSLLHELRMGGLRPAERAVVFLTDPLRPSATAKLVALIAIDDRRD